jgi:hypothetical protein
VDWVNFQTELARCAYDTIGWSNNISVWWVRSKKRVRELLNSGRVLVELASGMLESTKRDSTLRISFGWIEQYGHKNFHAAHFPGCSPVAFENGCTESGECAIGWYGPLGGSIHKFEK